MVFYQGKKKEQLETLQELNQISGTIIFYESPYRVLKTIENIGTAFTTETNIVLCRELTKLHEEYIRGSVEEVVAYLSENTIKGECCLLVENIQAKSQEEGFDSDLSLIEHVNLVVDLEEISVKDAIKEVAKIRGLKKQEVYKEYHS